MPLASSRNPSEWTYLIDDHHATLVKFCTSTQARFIFITTYSEVYLEVGQAPPPLSGKKLVN